jgi:predicted nucleic acid-binding protein
MDSAVTADSDVFITGDKDLLDPRIELHRPVIVTPREFWELVRTERQTNNA